MAKKEVFMPKLGESVTEGTISRWFVQVGDAVLQYDPIAEVETDKVATEIPAPFSGTIEKLLVDEFQTVPCQTPICLIETSSKEQMSEKPSFHEQTETTMKTRYSPVVLRLAKEHQIDLKQVIGSGINGRITKKDVMRYVSKPDEQKKIPKQDEQLKNQEEIKVTALRRAIANKMVQSKTEIPHAWMMIEADVTNLVRLRNQKKEAFLKEEGAPLTSFAFFIKAVAESLKEYPMLNATWQEDRIIQHSDIHLSIAIAAHDAVFVPVLKHAHLLSVAGIAKQLDQLVEKTRKQELVPDDLTGGTFTVNNTGAFGSVLSAPIIQPPQAALITMEQIQKKPVVIDDDKIAIRDRVNLCLSLDHRLLDGFICGMFLQRIKERLEHISSEHSSIY